MKKSQKLLLVAGFLAGLLLSCQISDNLFDRFSLPASVPVGLQPTSPALPSPTSANTPKVPPSTSIFRDEFSDSSGGWETANFVEGSTGHYEGGFRIKLNRARYLLWSTAGKDYQDVRIEVDVNLLDGGVDNTFGVICRYQDSGNFYALMISSDGYYAIRKRVQGAALEIISGNGYQFSDEISSARQKNLLRGECAGDRIRLYANGILLAEVIDSDLIAGTFAAQTTSLMFDNFVASPVE